MKQDDAKLIADYVDSCMRKKPDRDLFKQIGDRFAQADLVPVLRFKYKGNWWRRVRCDGSLDMESGYPKEAAIKHAEDLGLTAEFVEAD